MVEPVGGMIWNNSSAIKMWIWKYKDKCQSQSKIGSIWICIKCFVCLCMYDFLLFFLEIYSYNHETPGNCNHTSKQFAHSSVLSVRSLHVLSVPAWVYFSLLSCSKNKINWVNWWFLSCLKILACMVVIPVISLAILGNISFGKVDKPDF